MKDYTKTKIWANEIADISSTIDSTKEFYKTRINALSEEGDANSKYDSEILEELQERITCLEWAIKIINAPFKIK